MKMTTTKTDMTHFKRIDIECGHEYTYNDSRIPSVTESIRLAYPVKFIPPYALDRGTDIHQAISILAGGEELDWPGATERDFAAIEYGMQKYKELTVMKPDVKIELPHYAPGDMFGFTPDLIVESVCVDWKTGEPLTAKDKATGDTPYSLQACAYLAGLKQIYGKDFKFLMVYVDKKITIEEKFSELRYQRFRMMLEVMRTRILNGG